MNRDIDFSSFSFDESENIRDEAKMGKESRLCKLLDEIELDIETDCFDEAAELFCKIEAEIPREFWAFSPRFHLDKLMVELKCCDDNALIEKFQQVEQHSSYKKAKSLAVKQNDTALISRLNNIADTVTKAKEEEETRLAEEARSAEERRLEEAQKRKEERKREEERERKEEEERIRKEFEAKFEISNGVIVKCKGSEMEVVIPNSVTSISEM